MRVWSVLRFGAAQGVLDGIDAFVAEAGDFEVGADFGGLWGEAFGDVGLQLVLDDFGGEFDLVPDFGVAVWKGVSVFEVTRQEGSYPYVIESLKASTAWPYFLFSGQPMSAYSVSMGILVFSATCRIIEATIFPLLNRSSHRTISSGDTRRLERSM